MMKKTSSHELELDNAGFSFVPTLGHSSFQSPSPNSKNDVKTLEIQDQENFSLLKNQKSSNKPLRFPSAFQQIYLTQRLPKPQPRNQPANLRRVLQIAFPFHWHGLLKAATKRHHAPSEKR
jgi:hypothetical protein